MLKLRFAKDLSDRESVEDIFLVKHVALASGKNSKPYLNIVLTDRSGDLEARVWENAEQAKEILKKNAFFKFQGKINVYQNRKQLVISAYSEVLASELDMKDFFAESLVNPDELYEELLEFAESIENPFSKKLAFAVLKDPDVVTKIKVAPAAKSVHHAYRGGLVEHMVSISKMLSYLAEHYKGVLDRDLLLLGGFFHDIAKIWELDFGLSTDYTSEGRLVGHLVMGVELIERKCSEIEGFPEHLKLLVKHLILAHHGEYEYGSPKRPKFLEALVVHFIDDLDSKINAIHKFIAADENPGNWTAINKMYERFFYKGPKSQS